MCPNKGAMVEILNGKCCYPTTFLASKVEKKLLMNCTSHWLGTLKPPSCLIDLVVETWPRGLLQ
jgi:hypothetical protein